MGKKAVPKPRRFWMMLSAAQCDMLYMKHAEKYRKLERDLYQSKWFDYRPLHPLQATYEFAQAYREAFRYITAIRFDRGAARYVKGFSGNDMLALRPQSLTGFFKARIFADQNGLPYDFMCRAAMRYAEAASWTNMPRPTQLYGEEIGNAILEAWIAEQETSPRRAQDRFYQVEAYRGHPYQVEYAHYLLNIVARDQRHVAQRLATVLHDAPIELIESRFEASDISAARDFRALYSQD